VKRHIKSCLPDTGAGASSGLRECPHRMLSTTATVPASCSGQTCVTVEVPRKTINSQPSTLPRKLVTINSQPSTLPRKTINSQPSTLSAATEGSSKPCGLTYGHGLSAPGYPATVPVMSHCDPFTQCDRTGRYRGSGPCEESADPNSILPGGLGTVPGIL
jgi:hypothetical protein